MPAKRDAFAHSYNLSTPATVTFIERPGHGDFKAKPHTYSLPEFRQHVDAFAAAGRDFQGALGVSSAEMAQFAHAAFSAMNKATTSPEPR